MGKGRQREAIDEAIKSFKKPVTASEVAKKAGEICGDKLAPTVTGYYLRQNHSVRCIEKLEGTKTVRLYVMKNEYIDFERIRKRSKETDS